jgi:hypothetical protein
MNKAYYSTTFAQSADKVWSVIGDFNGFQWAEGVGKSRIENKKGNNDVGAVRDFQYRGRPVRQRLLAHSNQERSYSYESAEPMDSLKVYRQTLRVAPIVDTNTAFVEWSTEFDAPAQETELLEQIFREECARSLEKLRTYLAEQ